MKNTRLMRLLIAMIAALMVLGCVLTSCTKTPDDPAKDTSDTNDTGETPTGPEETEEDLYEALRGLDYSDANGNKTEFEILTYAAPGGWLQYFEEADGGDERLNEATYDRNGVVEEMLNIAITIKPSAAFDNVVSDYLMLAMGGASVDMPDLVVPWATEKVSSLISGNHLADIKEMEYMNLEADYYNQSANRNFTYKGIQYLFVSDLTYSVQQRYAFLANLDIIDGWVDWSELETEEDNFYDLVIEGDFTVANMLKMMEGYYSNNGSEDPKSHTYGLAINYGCAGRMFQDWGVELVSLNDEGNLVFNLYNADIEAKYTKLNEIVYSADTFVSDSNDHYAIFNQGRAMFSNYSSDPYQFINSPWKDVHFSYGPLPKYDAADDYVTVSHGGLILVPAKVKDLQKVGAVSEALSIASSYYIKDAYIEYYFENRVIQDTEGKALYKILRDTAYIDMNRYVDPTGEFQNPNYILNPLKKKDALSTYDKENGESAQKTYNDWFAKLKTKG